LHNSKNYSHLIVIFLIIASFVAFGRVLGNDFINFDDPVYVTQNTYLPLGFTLKGIFWAFSTTYAEFWHPMTWLSLLLDYQLYGLNAGGYHMTNVILHILSTLLLFWLFNHITGSIWRSAFVAAFFALHPLRVESVAWIAERKDVLSLFFGMLTLCFYVYYTEKPDIRRYLLVVFSFVCALMSKPTVVTMPVLMILLDYWPLGRFQTGNIAENQPPVAHVHKKKKKQKSGEKAIKKNISSSNDFKLPETKIAGIIPLWQVKEKAPFFILSAIFSIITIYAQRSMFTDEHSVTARLANASVSVYRYLENTFWPHHLAIFYPFSDNLPLWLVCGSTLLIVLISIAVIMAWKRLPYFFVGWLWFLVALIPVIGIIRSTSHSMHDCYTYLPSIGPAIMLAWGVPTLFPNRELHRKITFPVSIAALLMLSLITGRQCGYWKNDTTIFSRTLQMTKNNSLMHINLGTTLFYQGEIQESLYHYDEAAKIAPNDPDAYLNRGIVYTKLGQYQNALEDFNKAIELKPSRDIEMFYNKRGNVYLETGRYQKAIDDFNKAVFLNPEYADAYGNRASSYLNQGNKELGCQDAIRACSFGNCKILEIARSRKDCN
jgi:protein O-mannosyl-transferase